MDPGRAAMIAGIKSPTRGSSTGRDITAPRHDPGNRITKPSRPQQRAPAQSSNRDQQSNPRNFKTQDEQSEEFVAGEDKFVLRQSKKKADIRVRERRAKPIDFLAFNLRWVDEDRDTLDDDEKDALITVPSPAKVIEGLNEAQLTELEPEVTSYRTLETSARNLEYWNAILALCDDRRRQLAPQGPEGRTVGSVSADVDKILAPKTYEQLEALEKQIRAKLDSNDASVDTDYWGGLLKSLLVYNAKAQLKKITQSIREARAEKLKAMDIEKLVAAGSSALVAGGKRTGGSVAQGSSAGLGASGGAPGSSSGALPPGTARFAQSTNDEDFSAATRALYERELARGVGEDEEILTAEEAPATGPRPAWADKYRPRKPRYFNRVQMGYEWNKYNQTHYDYDNPPPKVVHGYRFNIFYPDLIDKTKAPTFKIIREGGRRRGESFAPAGQEDTCLIRFIAGPPYEDIAFRIVDKEWDFSAKRERGYKSSFDKVSLLCFDFFSSFFIHAIRLRSLPSCRDQLRPTSCCGIRKWCGSWHSAFWMQ